MCMEEEREMIDKLLKALWITFFILAALGFLYLMFHLAIVVFYFVWGIEPVHNFPLLFE